jgi:hypothetical protein
MKHKPLWLLGLTLTACVSPRHQERFVPAEEAAWFKFPEELPETGTQNIPGALAAAMQLAMDDFLPWDAQPPRGATRQQVCLHQRQSYNVEAAPGPEGIVWVSIALSPGACTQGPGPLLDMSALYAVDTHGWRILAVREP